MYCNHYTLYHLTMREPESSGKSTRTGAVEPRGASSPAFLLAQIGAHGAARFAERLEALGITPAHAGLLRVISASAGASQQRVAVTLGMFASRMVALVDELQEGKLVERLSNPEDRRTYSLVLTAEGRRVLEAIGRVAREHQEDLLGALSKAERDTLAALLLRVADQQGLARGVHPAFARMGGRRSAASKVTSRRGSD
jgi:DNA-binding MarR family transcriptional regulator